MDTSRKYRPSALFFVAFAIYLLFPLSLTYNKDGLIENVPLNGITPLSPGGLHLFHGRAEDPKLAQKSGRAAFEVFLCKARTILPEDKAQKLLHLQSGVVSPGCPAILATLLSRPFGFPDDGRKFPKGFHSSYSGLSPPQGV
ncbi:MAG TPA: hypothetical protein VF790_02370 [Dissulfurispiraceae bacterium]